MRILSIILACSLSLMMHAQSEYLPPTFSAVNVSTSIRSADNLQSYSIGAGYTNRKNFGFSLVASRSEFGNNESYTQLSETHIGPRGELFLGKNGLVSKFGIEYGFGKAKGSSLVQNELQKETKHKVLMDLSFSLPIGSKSGVAIFPTIYGSVSNQNYGMGGINYFQNMRSLLWKDFHEEIAVSIPMVINFSGAQLAVIPKMGRSIYNTFFELGLAANLYHSARCVIVRRKNKRNKGLSKFYN